MWRPRWWWSPCPSKQPHCPPTASSRYSWIWPRSGSTWPNVRALMRYPQSDIFQTMGPQDQVPDRDFDEIFFSWNFMKFLEIHISYIAKSPFEISQNNKKFWWNVSYEVSLERQLYRLEMICNRNVYTKLFRFRRKNKNIMYKTNLYLISYFYILLRRHLEFSFRIY